MKRYPVMLGIKLTVAGTVLELKITISPDSLLIDAVVKNYFRISFEIHKHIR
jgi:hypothetical protein